MNIRESQNYEKRREQLWSDIFTFKNYQTGSDLMNLRLVRQVMRNTLTKLDLDMESMSDKEIVDKILKSDFEIPHIVDEDFWDIWNSKDWAYSQGRDGEKIYDEGMVPIIWTPLSPWEHSSFEQILRFFSEKMKNQMINNGFETSMSTDIYGEMILFALWGFADESDKSERMENARKLATKSVKRHEL